MATPIFWTAERIELLRQLYPCTPAKEVARILGTTAFAVKNRACMYGVRKSPEALKAAKDATLFRKGNVPFTKGKKRAEFMSEENIRKCERTQFKSGHIPHNARPDFFENFDKDGYVRIKLPGYRKMVHKHRWVWEQHNGPIPEGCQIHFKDGDRTNCDISNLEIMTIQENAKRNVVWNRYPREVAEIISLRGALNRQINKHKSNQK